MNSRHPFRFAASFVAILMTACSISAQTPVSAGWGGIGTPSDAPGDPASSYALGGVDHVNYYTGSVNVAIPLLTFGGRGTEAKAITLPTQRQWSVYLGGATSLMGTYPGSAYNGASVDVVSTSPNPYYCLNSSTHIYHGNQATTYLTWRQPDGSRIVLIDTLYDGQPKDPISCQPVDRGNTFRSTDGSGWTFVADADVHDGDLSVTGKLISRDGTKFWFTGGVSYLEDRNGNEIQTYPTSGTSTGGIYTVTDPIGRPSTINFTETPSINSQDVITYPGFNGASRTIKVNYALLGSALASGESLQKYHDLFPSLAGSSTTQFNPYITSSVVLADGTSYTMTYNSYGELVKLTLPTGAFIAYKYSEAYAGGSSGVIPLVDGVNYNIVRPLVERDEYVNGGTTPSAKMVYSTTTGTDAGTARPYLEANVKFEDPIGNVLRQENHYFYGNPLSTAAPPAVNTYADWWEGLEYRTDMLDAAGAATLQKTQRLYQQRPWAASETNQWFSTTSDVAPLHDPQLCQINTTFDGSATSASVYFYL